MGRIRMLTIVSAILCALPAIISSQEPANKRLSVPELVKVVSAGIVHIGTMDINGKALGQGSGFVAKPDGTIVTSFHVIEAARAIVVKTSDGEIYDRVEVLDYDRAGDPRDHELAEGDKGRGETVAAQYNERRRCRDVQTVEGSRVSRRRPAQNTARRILDRPQSKFLS